MPTSNAQAESALYPVIRLQTLLLGLALVGCLWSPSLDADPNDAGNSELKKDLPFDLLPGISYVERNGNSLRANCYIPKGKGPFPGVLMVHGGAWRVGNPLHMHGHAVRVLGVRWLWFGARRCVAVGVSRRAHRVRRVLMFGARR